MTLSDRLRARVRAYVLGQATIDSGVATWGHSPETYQPAQYVNYLATSNAVYACARLRADTLSSLPIKLYRGSGDSKKEITGGPLYDLLHKVNDHWTFHRLLAMWEYSMCLWGECYLFLERGQAGRMPPQEMWWGRADHVYVYPDPVDYIKGYGYVPTDGAEPIAYLPGEVLAFRYPNPANEWRGLSPLAAARLSADSANAAMKSNRNIFANGIQMGGMVSPPSGQVFTEEQAKALEQNIARRFQGVDRAHRWSVFSRELKIEQVGISPKDAEFLGLLQWSLEDVCRAYSVPIDLIGGQRTYENVNAAHLALWDNCIIPEKRILEQELTEQLLPMFPGQADSVELDTSEVAVLREDDAAAWAMSSQQIDRGAITINEWRKAEGLDPVAWGDVYWASSSMTPIENGDKPEPPPAPVMQPAPEQEEEPEEEPAEDSDQADNTEAPPEPQRMVRMVDIPFGGELHRLYWSRFVRSTEAWERKLTPVVQELFRRQRLSVLARLQQRAARSPEDVLDEPFDKATWRKRFAETVRVVLVGIVAEAGEEALKDLGLSMAFDVHDPLVDAFLKARAQRFAEKVNDTTYDMLKDEMTKGINEGEDIPTLAARVEKVMGDRIRSTPETIARTEVIGSYNGGTKEAWKQSGVVTKKRWLSTLDDRVRTPENGDDFDHKGAHDEVVPIDEPFVRTGEPLDFPGDGAGSAGNVINCRCTMTGIVDVLDKGE